MRTALAAKRMIQAVAVLYGALGAILGYLGVRILLSGISSAGANQVVAGPVFLIFAVLLLGVAAQTLFRFSINATRGVAAVTSLLIAGQVIDLFRSSGQITPITLSLGLLVGLVSYVAVAKAFAKAVSTVLAESDPGRVGATTRVQT
jgi:hypothetical protein